MTDINGIFSVCEAVGTAAFAVSGAMVAVDKGTDIFGVLLMAVFTALGGGMSAQAVGGAVGHNPISIIVPCHRVIGANGSLTGYAGGIDKKIGLLTLEGVDVGRLTLSKCKTKCNAP